MNVIVTGEATLSPVPLPGIKRKQLAWKATILLCHYYADGLVF